MTLEERWKAYLGETEVVWQRHKLSLARDVNNYGVIRARPEADLHVSFRVGDLYTPRDILWGDVRAGGAAPRFCGRENEQTCEGEEVT